VRTNDPEKYIPENDVVMFPSTHDIRPEHLERNMEFLQHILDKGNVVTIVSKPHLVCIKAICEKFEAYKDKLILRFTIGTANVKALKYFEPNAPSFEERLDCLKWAFQEGFSTSISCEPMLDNNIDAVLNEVFPYVNETIWIGKANELLERKNGKKGRLEINGHYDPITIKVAKRLIAWQSDENILQLYEKYKDDPKIWWKLEIRDVLKRHSIKDERIYKPFGIAI
jgi:DNA repair photolyase